MASSRAARWSRVSILPKRSSANQRPEVQHPSGSTLAVSAILGVGAARLTRVHHRLKQVDERTMNAFRIYTARGPYGDEHLPRRDEHLVGRIDRRDGIRLVR
jgi:hypothetical protein